VEINNFMNLKNNKMNKKNIIKFSAGIAVLASLLFYGVSKYSENEEEKALVIVNQKNYKVIKSLFSSDSSRDNLKAFDKEMDNFNTKDNLCEKVSDKLKKQECFNKEALMKQFISQNLDKKNDLNFKLLNEKYFTLISQMFEYKNSQDVSKLLNEEKNKELTSKYFNIRKKLADRSIFTNTILQKPNKWIIPSYYTNKFIVQSNEIKILIQDLKNAVNSDCTGMFETEKCNLTIDEVDKLKVQEVGQFETLSGTLDDPYFKIFENTINKGFQREIIKIEK
jgi:hypothetical protein